MSNYAISLKRSTALLAALTFMAMLTVVNLASIFGTVSAAQLTERSLALSSSLPGDETGDGVAGSETNGAEAIHTFTFKVATTASIGGIELEYCTAAVGTCTKPTGLDLTSATLGATTGLAGWAKDAGSDDQVFMMDIGSAEAKTAGNTVVININNVVNPTDYGTFFVRITTYEDDTFGDEVDDGTVTSAITEGITITTRVTETLGFSTTADTSTGVPAEGSSCAPLTGSGAIQMGDPTEHTLSISESYDAYSVFRLYTNASNGVAVQYNGATLTKANGIDEIAEIGGTMAYTAIGTEQFGLGVDASNGGISEADSTWSTDTPGALELGANYGSAAGAIDTNGAGARFAFVADTPTTMAESDTNFGGYVDCATAAVRYIANVSPLTPSGVYSTTIVYSAVPTY